MVIDFAATKARVKREKDPAVRRIALRRKMAEHGHMWKWAGGEGMRLTRLQWTILGGLSNPKLYRRMRCSGWEYFMEDGV